MSHTVKLTPQAEADLTAEFWYIFERDRMNAERWLDELILAIQSLELFPARCAIAPESDYLGNDVRHLIFKSHRVVFYVHQEQTVVHVLAVRHAARQVIGEVAAPNLNDDDR